MEAMHRTSPLPARGEVFLDARGTDRSLRVTWHREAGVVVLSLWREHTCAGTFRLAISEVPALIAVLRAGLESAYDEARESLLASLGEGSVEAGHGAFPVAREVC